MTRKILGHFYSPREWIVFIEVIFVYSEIRDDLPTAGKEEDYNTYKKMKILRFISMIVLLIEVVFSKPAWCKEKGQNIDVYILYLRITAERILTK